MTVRETERWLAGLQERFSAVLRTPLSAAGGTLHSEAGGYPTAAVEDILSSSKLTAAERLGVYQRQYWIRLLRLLQEQYPLTTRLCGAWAFNQHAIAYLSAHAPRDRDLASVAEGFATFLEATARQDPALPRAMLRETSVRVAGAPALPRDALLQAARLDAAFRRVFMAPEEPPFRLTAEAAASLADRHLRLSRAFAQVDENWPLLELRAAACADEIPIALPPPLPRRRSWAIFRTDRGVAHLALDREQARLLELVPSHTLGDALSILETECDPADRDALPARTRRFLAQAVRRGFFAES